MSASFPYLFRITVADNATTDSTLDVARRHAFDHPEVAWVHLAGKRRGRALKHELRGMTRPSMASAAVPL